MASSKAESLCFSHCVSKARNGPPVKMLARPSLLRFVAERQAHSVASRGVLRWRPLHFLLATGGGYATYRGYRSHKEKQLEEQGIEVPPRIAHPWEVWLYRSLPTRLVSRAWGRLSRVELPVWLRGPVLGLYAWAFGVDLREAAEEDLRHYASLSHFFARRLKPHARPLHAAHPRLRLRLRLPLVSEGGGEGGREGGALLRPQGHAPLSPPLPSPDAGQPLGRPDPELRAGAELRGGAGQGRHLLPGGLPGAPPPHTPPPPGTPAPPPHNSGTYPY
uniref:Phosphatidylserine decarboxylase n=1 Tax=Anolis carolinensis TaxID=28377 RepID=A0A803TFC7_ANOCA